MLALVKEVVAAIAVAKIVELPRLGCLPSSLMTRSERRFSTFSFLFFGW